MEYSGYLHLFVDTDLDIRFTDRLDAVIPYVFTPQYSSTLQSCSTYLQCSLQGNVPPLKVHPQGSP